MRYTGVGGLVACLTVAAGVFWTGEVAQGSPLSRAIENQEKAKSFRAVRRVTIPGSPIQESPETKIYYSEGKLRTEDSPGTYSVADAATKKMVRVEASAKLVRVTPLSGGVGSEHAFRSEMVREAIAKKQFKDLGLQVVDGRRLRAYRFEQPAGANDNGIATVTTYWIDAKRDLLVKSESVSPSPEFLVPNGLPPANPGDPVPQKKLKPFVRTEVTEYLSFDEDLDPALFDQTPPAGYKVEELKPHASADPLLMPEPLLRAVENQEKAKSYRAVRRTTTPNGLVQEMKIYFAEGKKRVDQKEGSQATAMVVDAVTGQSLMLDLTHKVAGVGKQTLPGGFVSEHARECDAIRQAIAKNEVKDLGVQVVDGRRLRAYRYHSDAAAKSTYWVDAKRGWLVKSEIVAQSVRFKVVLNKKPPGELNDFETRKKMAESPVETVKAVPVPEDKPAVHTVVTEYLGFDEDLDPALFDQTIPPGYKVTKIQTIVTKESPKP